MHLSNFKNFILFIVFTSYLNIHFSHAQEVDQLATYNTYDALVHQKNTGYYNGPEFQDIYLTNSNSDRYFKQFDFSKGSISYKDQVYFDMLLKYDIYDDQIITRSDDDLNLFKVNLISDYITEFTIHNRKFVKIPDFDKDGGIKFYEIAYVGDHLSLYIKHQKEKKETTINFTLRFDFVNENYYLLYKNGAYQRFESIKELKKLLPQQEKQIQNYYKKNKSVYKSDMDRFMTDIITSLNQNS